MDIFAYCARSFAEAAEQAAGVKPFTCPPINSDTFDPAWLQGFDLLYFDLHGLPGRAFWYEEEMIGLVPTRIIALTAAQIRQADLSEAVVYATSCYLAEDDSPMLDALLEAGARYVIGGPGKNWSNSTSASGASALGKFFIEEMRQGSPPLKALAKAKLMLQKVSRNRDELLDTLEFKAFYRES